MLLHASWEDIRKLKDERESMRDDIRELKDEVRESMRELKAEVRESLRELKDEVQMMRDRWGPTPATEGRSSWG